MGGAAQSAAGAQVVDNVLNGRPAGEGAVEQFASGMPGMGVVTAVMQRESCFLAGTSVTVGTGDQAMIETLRIGQRVLTPESSPRVLSRSGQGGPLSPVSGSGSETAVDPATWRSYTVRLLDARTGWDIFDITLLRPQGWMAQHARQVAGRSEVWVDFEELNARGWAQVIEEKPCPQIAEGSGRVITATITHANDDVRTLTMNSGETLFVTGNHRMFSATAQDWVPVKDLSVGEELQTSRGRESVAALGYQRGRHQVYNLEVEAEHCYFVGNGEVLTHNATSCSEHFSSSKEGVKMADETQEFRDKHADGDNPHRNFLTAEVEVDGKTKMAHFKNDPGGMHSEQRLVAWQDKMEQRGKTVTVKQIHSERPPCGAMSANCRDTLGKKYGDSVKVYHGKRRK